MEKRSHVIYFIDSYDFIMFVYLQAVISPVRQAVKSKKKKVSVYTTLSHSLYDLKILCDVIK